MKQRDYGISRLKGIIDSSSVGQPCQHHEKEMTLAASYKEKTIIAKYLQRSKATIPAMQFQTMQWNRANRQNLNQWGILYTIMGMLQAMTTSQIRTWCCQIKLYARTRFSRHDHRRPLCTQSRACPVDETSSSCACRATAPIPCPFGFAVKIYDPPSPMILCHLPTHIQQYCVLESHKKTPPDDTASPPRL